jgi:hypothetical protein
MALAKESKQQQSKAKQSLLSRDRTREFALRFLLIPPPLASSFFFKSSPAAVPVRRPSHQSNGGEEEKERGRQTGPTHIPRWLLPSRSLSNPFPGLSPCRQTDKTAAFIFSFFFLPPSPSSRPTLSNKI